MNQVHRTSRCSSTGSRQRCLVSLSSRDVLLREFRFVFLSLNKTDPRNHSKSHEQNSYASCILVDGLTWQGNLSIDDTTPDIDRFIEC